MTQLKMEQVIGWREIGSDQGPHSSAEKRRSHAAFARASELTPKSKGKLILVDEEVTPRNIARSGV